MGMCFFGGCVSGTDDTDVAISLNEADDEKVACSDVANDKLTLLCFRMIGVSEDPCERISKHCDGIVEGYAMFAKVGRRFASIPFELHTVV
jgi:hypothetical protein